MLKDWNTLENSKIVLYIIWYIWIRWTYFVIFEVLEISYIIYYSFILILYYKSDKIEKDSYKIIMNNCLRIVESIYQFNMRKLIVDIYFIFFQSHANYQLTFVTFYNYKKGQLIIYWDELLWENLEKINGSTKLNERMESYLEILITWLLKY